MEHISQLSNDTQEIFIPGNRIDSIKYCTELFIKISNEAILNRGSFSVALAGGSTPKAIYQNLSLPQNIQRVDWKRVLLFWGDERPVPQEHPDSNYSMAMQTGFYKIPIPKENIFRMVAENDIEKNATLYEKFIKDRVIEQRFDLIFLGMGDDGHTASLFPETKALEITDKLVAANFIPQKNTWRMTLTYPCINAARNICICVFGKEKENMLEKIFFQQASKNCVPIQNIGSSENKALWILDKEAAQKILENKKTFF